MHRSLTKAKYGKFKAVVTIIAFVSKSVPSDICSAKPMYDFVLKELCFSSAQFLLNSPSIEPFT